MTFISFNFNIDDRNEMVNFQTDHSFVIISLFHLKKYDVRRVMACKC